MISTILGQFVKDLFNLSEPTDIDDGQTRVKKITCILEFILNILQESRDYLDEEQLNEKVKKSLCDGLLNINNEISKLMAYLTPANDIDRVPSEIQSSDERKANSADSGPQVTILTTQLSVSHLLQSELQHYTVRDLEVTSYNSLNDIMEPNKESNKYYLRLLELRDSVIVDGHLTLSRMLWNSIERRDKSLYWCQLCSHQVAWQNGCEAHIGSLVHTSKLAAAKICIPSLGVYSNTLVSGTTESTLQCCICAAKYTIADDVKHNESADHKQALAAARTKCVSLFKQIETASNRMEIENGVFFEKISEICQEHNIILFQNDLKCQTCGVHVKLDMENLFKHITDQTHRKLHQSDSMQKFKNLPVIPLAINTMYRGCIQVYKTKNTSYCSICSIFLWDVSISQIEKHIQSLVHNAFLVMYSRLEEKTPPMILCDYDDSKANRGLVEYCADTDEYYTLSEDKPRWRYEDEKKVVVDGKIVVDKPSWHIMTFNEDQYFCSPCNLNTKTEELSRHIDTDAHRENLKDWPLCTDFRQHLMREYVKAGIAYCIGCETFLSKYNLKDHAESTDHKTRSSQLIGECNNLKLSFNEKYIKAAYPYFREGPSKVFLILLKQNELNFFASNDRIFCRLCKEEFDYHELKNIYEHIGRTGHFKRFVASRAITSIYEHPNFYRGFIMDKDRPDKVYCLVCNLIVPITEICSHWMGRVHTTILPSFIETVFSHHNIVYSDGYVHCNLCNEDLCDKELDVKEICRHVKSTEHLSKFEIVLRNKFGEVTGCYDDVQLALEGRKVDRFLHLNAAYCQLCNIVFNVEPCSELDQTSANLCEHRFSKMHYIFKHNVEKGSDLISLVPI